MGSGQTMLTIAFFVLVTVVVMNANKMLIDSELSYYEQGALEEGSNFANALLSEIVTKKFDSQMNSYPSSYYIPTNMFDAPSSMGAGAAAINRINPTVGGKLVPDVAPYKSIKGSDATYDFDDVDDYNNYERTVNSQDIIGLHLVVKVYYVRKSNTAVAATSQTYYKRIDVTVDHPRYLQRKITVSAIASY
jgi:hypothetical protein